MPALFTPPKRFDGYHREVKMCDSPIKPLPIEETGDFWEDHYRKFPHMRPKKAVFPLTKEPVKRAGVIFSAGLQLIIDKLPPQYR
jgi:hypothetical protein